MYDQRETIAKAVENINKQEYLLPAIQREIVWDRDQIRLLFDSVLRGYPIGTFLYWDIEKDKKEEYKMYGFIQDYITTKKYFQTEAKARNSEVQPDGVNPKLILDGQQRLSSFFIGLKGSYTYKQKHREYQNKDAWKKSKLYLNITKDPKNEIQFEGDREIKFDFRFLPEDEKIVPKEDEKWFRAGAILNYPKDTEKEELIEKLREKVPEEKERFVNRNINRLWRNIHDKKYITYYEEEIQDIDRVLDIFIRTNDGGTELQKSDLLLSIATAQWENYEAREELTSFVDHLNTQLPKTNNYSKDFVLKSSLVLADLTVRYRIRNFNRENVAKIESEWEEIKDAIEQAAKVVNNYGIDEETLTSQNAVIPIAYYFKENDIEASDLRRGKKIYSKIRGDIKRWLLTSLLNGTFSGNSDTILREARDALQESEGKSFPIEEINKRIKNMGKLVGFNEEVANNILLNEKGDKRTFLALTLLYPENDWGTMSFHQDHIFPESKLEEKPLLEKGIEIERAKKFNEMKDQLANLQLLTESENESKQDQDFFEWIQDQPDEFYDRHFIPRKEKYHKTENFNMFMEERRKNIQEHLISILSK